MRNVQKFDFEGMDVRTTIVNDEPLFVAKDVAVTLGFELLPLS
ncbi:hypothetical protein [Fructilactobacillus sanfranciscensis]|nr:hypothetical protein [Fructilactobacillus sanfranciscensis]